MNRINVMLAGSLALVLGACSVKKYSDNETSPATADPWLRSQSVSDCPQAACLFALVVDANNQPIDNAEVEVEGTAVRVVSDPRGRVVAEGAGVTG